MDKYDSQRLKVLVVVAVVSAMLLVVPVVGLWLLFG